MQTEVSNFVYGSAEHFQELLDFQQRIIDNPALLQSPADFSLSRTDLFNATAEKSALFYKTFVLAQNGQGQEGSAPRLPLFTSLWLREPLACSTGIFLGATTVENLATEDQKKQFLPKIRTFDHILCYAQTELAHGSDARSIQTEAIFDEKSDTFTINTPNAGAAKFWIGDLGVYANIAVVYAQLIVQGKRVSDTPQAFLVPIRCTKTHQALPGITVGDLGPKYSYSSKDNGFLVLSKVSVPRTNMLMRFLEVSREGKVTTKNDKLEGKQRAVFSALSEARLNLARNSTFLLAKAITITYNYSLKRQQFRGENLLYYQTQRDKLLSAVSELYALSVTVQESSIPHNSVQHAHMCAIKAYFTENCLAHIETLRQCCGGHGYSSFSGFQDLLGLSLPATTFEGDNTLLYLQCARHLQKAYDKIILKNESFTDDIQVDYFRQYREGVWRLRLSQQNVRNLDVLESVLGACVVNEVRLAHRRLQEGVIDKKLSEQQSFDTYAGTRLLQSAKLHSLYFVFRHFKQRILALPEQSQCQNALYLLCEYYAISKIIDFCSVAAYSSGVLQSKDLSVLRQRRSELIDEGAENLSLYIGALAIRDELLSSAIGQKNADPYATLLSWSQQHNPVNRDGNSQAIFKEIQPIFGKLGEKVKPQLSVEQKPRL